MTTLDPFEKPVLDFIEEWDIQEIKDFVEYNTGEEFKEERMWVIAAKNIASWDYPGFAFCLNIQPMTEADYDYEGV